MRQVGKSATGVTKYRLRTRMPVLDVKDGIVAGLFQHFHKIEVEHGIVLAKQHHEAHGIAADFINHFAKRDELPCPLRHFDRLARAQELDQLNDFNVELGAAIAQRRDGRLHAFDISGVISSPDVDQRAKSALKL